ncbi:MULTISPECIES: 4-carboxymuconolactone decarboxylase [Cyclobacteriaceae]|uniref:4-carboxymuconolactone decarboxylase n=1 Tax=Mongoliitalea lutea TaxID=849756 RepID=A0A8J3CYH0_9BACT|nr:MULTISPECIES: 4-carboxymuconolactone decarboxylase [Cyclobacteriaceae]UJP64943.1 4-carboxymuconolactone decarboxylase [Mongoliitalea daihaiensis]GHB34556.1 4-carboxymuconolactone decarboxylase [Mongoliitalea lutea]
MNPTDKYQKGMQTRKSVLGEAHVAKAEAAKTSFDEGFQQFITESAWGTVWSSEHLTKRERSMITIALLAGLGHEEELILHFKATQQTGASLEDIQEVLMHVAIYAGVPAANTAFRIAKQVFNL